MAPNTIRPTTIGEVRAHLRQELSAEERAAYRGITLAGMTGIKFERLIGINTPEELIISEWYGKQFIPADEPQSVYLVSIGKGLAAQFHPDWVARMFQDKGMNRPSNKTKSEMDAEYRNAARPSPPEEEDAELEELLDSVATSYLAWAETQFSSLKSGPSQTKGEELRLDSSASDTTSSYELGADKDRNE